MQKANRQIGENGKAETPTVAVLSHGTGSRNQITENNNRFLGEGCLRPPVR